jgi:hypothetical protein
MRKPSFVLALVLAVGVVAAQEAKKPAAQATGKTHKWTAEVVSSDAVAKTVTVKDEKGKATTLPAEGKALNYLRSLKAGNKVELTCRDNVKGEHQAIVNIHLAKAKKKK